MRIKLSTFLVILALVLLAFGRVYVEIVKADEATAESPSRLEVMLQYDNVLATVPQPITLAPEEKSSQSYLQNTQFGSEIYFYEDPQVQRKVAEFKEKYGISVVCPLYDVNVETGEKTENLLWTPREIGIILDEVPNLPAVYLDRKWEYFPKTIILIKPAGSSGGAGGLTDGNVLTFFLPANFNPDDLGIEAGGLLFGTAENSLKSVVVHEWTHNHQINSLKFLYQWIEAVGWKFDDNGELINTQPNEFEGLIYDESLKNPWEDQATAVAIFYFDPGRLNEAQRNFIIQEFPDWPPVIEYLNNPPRN